MYNILISSMLVFFLLYMQACAESMVGAACKAGERCSIKKSVIGEHCKIGDKVKITNSIIMHHVTILDGLVWCSYVYVYCHTLVDYASDVKG